MPDTKPSAAAVRLVQTIAKDLTDALENSDTLGKTEGQLMHVWAQRADAFAAEHGAGSLSIRQAHDTIVALGRERDAAIARAEAAEADLVRTRKLLANADHRGYTAEERVRELEAALNDIEERATYVLRIAEQEPAGLALRSAMQGIQRDAKEALAKAAAEEERG